MATDVSAPFPELELPPGATITVTASDVNADITLLNVYGITPVVSEETTVSGFVPLFTYGA